MMTRPTTVATPPRQVFLQIERWLLLATVGILPLAYARGILLEFVNMPKLTLLFVAVCIAGALRLAAAAVGASPNGLRLLLLPAGAMAIAFVLSWLVSDYRYWSLLGLYGRYAGLLPYLAVILFAVLAADAFARRPQSLIYALVIGGAGVGAYALIQMLFLGALVATNSPTAYVTSTLGHSNFAGGYLAIILPLSVGMWIQGGRLSRAGMGATILIASGLLFTVSQGGWVAGIGGIGLMTGLLGSRGHGWAARVGVGVAVLAAAASIGVIAVSMMIPHAYARLPGYLGTAVSRGFLWESALATAAERPLLGGGPNTFAIEGPLHRSVEGALLTNFLKGDEPHSVPLAMFANLGAVGLIAFVLLFLWALRKWRSNQPRSVLQTATMAALVAYAIQALVSIDEPPMRFTFWILLATIACFGAPDQAPLQDRTPSSLQVTSAWVAIAAGVVAAGVVIATLWGADYRANQATRSFTDGSVAEGRARFLQALSLRNDNEYKRRYAGALGTAALRGDGGDELIDEMHAVFSYLDSFPDAQALAYYGELLNLWSGERPAANREALVIYQQATTLDPYNPLLAVDVADALIQEDRPAEAEQQLEPFERLLTEEYPEYSPLYSDVWSALAIARVKLGRPDEAEATLTRVTETESCRYVIATELLKPRSEPERPRGLGLLCPEPLLELLPEN